MPEPAQWLSTRTSVVARVFIAVCLLTAVGELILSNAWIGLILLVAAALVTAGVYAAASPWLAALSVAVGAIVGGMMLVWTLIGALLAVVLVVLCTIDARRAT
jgi:hypothetical protein